MESLARIPTPVFAGLCLALLLTACTSNPGQHGPGTLSGYSPYSFSGVQRIVAVGDLHGDYDQFIAVMTMNGLIDSQGDWAGGAAHLVQLGDLVDRGPDSLKIINHLMRLERQARAANGYVHLLIGNHEAMNIHGDLRYIHPGEYQALVGEGSAQARERYLQTVLKARAKSNPALLQDREGALAALRKDFPLGYVEHRRLWQPGGKLASWVARHNTVVKLNDTLFVHGGLNPHAPPMSIKALNRKISKELSRPARPGREGLANSDQGPLWYRGLAENPAETELAPLDAMLRFYGASRVAIAHTPTAGAVLPRLGGRVILVDVGLASHYGGGLANLVIQDGQPLAMHRGALVPLPEDPADRGSMDAYFRQLSELEPGQTRLMKWLKRRQKQARPESAMPDLVL